MGNEELYTRYKNFRFELRKLIKIAKRNYYCKKFESVQGNMKKTWQLINELRGKSKTNIKASFIIDGQVVHDRREIAKEFNIFFRQLLVILILKCTLLSFLTNRKSLIINFLHFLILRKSRVIASSCIHALKMRYQILLEDLRMVKPATSQSHL